MAELGLAALWLAASLAGLQLMPAKWLVRGGADPARDPGQRIALVQAGLLAAALVVLEVAYLRADFSNYQVWTFTHSSRSGWERMGDSFSDPSLAMLVLVLTLCLASTGSKLLGNGLTAGVIARARRLIQGVALPVFAVLFGLRPFAAWALPQSEGQGAAPYLASNFCLPLLAVGAALLAAGWALFLASRRSAASLAAGNRSARLWLRASLVALTGASLAQLEGEWPPLVARSWTPADYVAGVAWLAAIALLVRLEVSDLRRCLSRRHPRRLRPADWGAMFLLGGIAAFLFGLIFAANGPRRELARLCEGQAQQVGSWHIALRRIMPVAQRDFTGLEARLDIRFPDGVVIALAPQLRTYLIAAGHGIGGSRRAARWNGELWVNEPAAIGSPGCVDLRLTWYPFVQWLRYSIWLAAGGALLMLLASLRGAWWRRGARQRIGHRRDDRPLRPADLA